MRSTRNVDFQHNRKAPPGRYASDLPTDFDVLRGEEEKVVSQ
jgi:hypothetical protein